MTNIWKMLHKLLKLKEKKMKATLYCKANYLLFLDSKDEVIAYQLDDSTIKQMKFYNIKFPSELPEGTKKTLLLTNMWSQILYEKENISDIEAKVVTYKMNESASRIAQLAKENLSKSLTVDGTDSECPSWVPIAKEHEDKLFQCKYCINESECYREM